jgi:hypothetical protein
MLAVAALALAPLVTAEAGIQATSGPALGFGVGSQYGRLGLQASYLQRLPGGLPLHAVPYVCAGISPDFDRFSGIGFCVGASVVYGRSHRAILDGHYGIQRQELLHLHGTFVTSNQIYGVHIGAGYEYLFDMGLYLRLLPGLIHPVARYTPGTESWGLSISVGLGWKAW